MTRVLKNKIVAGLAAICLIMAFSVPGIAADDDTVYTSITTKQLADIMNELDYEIELDTPDEPAPNDDITWYIDGEMCFLFILDQRTSVQFYCPVFTEVPLDDINSWNQTKRFSRSYVDDDGDPVLELDLDLSGGVTKGRIKDWLLTCIISLNQWKETLNIE